MSTPILWYKLNEDTADLGTDSSVNLTDMNNVGVVSINDATYGPVADFSAGTLTLPSANVPSALTGGSSRSYSFWVESAVSGDVKLIDIGTRVSTGDDWNIIVFGTAIRVTFFNIPAVDSSPTVLVAGQWYHVVVTFEDVGNNIKIYIDGSEELSATKGVATGSTDLEFGQFDAGFQDMRLLDMRIYDVAIDATEVSNLFGSGPEQAATVSATMYSNAADVVWGAITGATTYTLVTKENVSGDVVDTISETTELQADVYNLDDGVSYDFEVYTDLDPVTPILVSLANVTPVIDATSTGDLITFAGNDLTELNEDKLLEIDEFIKDVLNTGDTVQARVSFQNSIQQDQTLNFVQDGETISIAPNPTVLTPFTATGVPATDITLEFSDGSTTESMTFNQSLNQVTVASNTYNVGDTFIIDGKKCKVSELN